LCRGQGVDEKDKDDVEPVDLGGASSAQATAWWSLSISASPKAPIFLRILLDIYPVRSIMGDYPGIGYSKLFSYLSHLINMVVHSALLFHLSPGVSGERCATESNIGHFDSWHGGSGVEYWGDVVHGQHINDFYEHFHVYNR
jgi:hypothetical protein